MTRPAFPYYGSKVRLAKRLPPPMCDRIVEPFAGGAGYALHHRHLAVTLIDLDETICGVWAYLIGASSREILALPLVGAEQALEELAWPCAEAAHLVGYWLQPASAYPARKASTWAGYGKSSTWCEATRAHIARLVETIRHWRITCADYTTAPDVRATWLIDPPYQGRPGSHYRHGSEGLDYGALASWCKARQGQVIVCEAGEASWLDFAPLVSARGQRGHSVEAVCLMGERAQGVLV